jgi:hypothetical protein
LALATSIVGPPVNNCSARTTPPVSTVLSGLSPTDTVPLTVCMPDAGGRIGNAALLTVVDVPA